MSTSIENYCEQVEVLLLEAQAGLSGFSITQYDEDADANKNRITVKASPRQVALYGPDQVTPISWRIQVAVTVRLATRSTATLDTCIASVEYANDGMIDTITVANPTVVSTARPHGFSTGASVYILGSNCTPTINGARTITVTDADSFTVPVNVLLAGDSGFVMPAAAYTLAVAQFPAGMKVEPTDSGDLSHGDDIRTRTKVFNFIVMSEGEFTQNSYYLRTGGGYYLRPLS